MKSDAKQRLRSIIDRETLMTVNAEGCAACGRKFTLGDPVVLACGAWEGKPRLVHENEAVFDRQRSVFVERKCYEAGRNRSR